MKITIVGNLNKGVRASCGQITKVQFIYNCFKKEGYKVRCNDLSLKSTKLFLAFKLFHSFIVSKVIVVIPGPRSSHIVIPLAGILNVIFRKRLIYLAVGTGLVSEASMRQKVTNGEFDWKIDNNSFKTKIEKFAIKHFSLCAYETELIKDVHAKLYGGNNVVIPNYRDITTNIEDKSDSNNLKLIYLSRIRRDKGVFDLIDCVKKLNSTNHVIKLDIYGNIGEDVPENEVKLFYDLLDENIVYKGFIANDEVISTMSQYDLFCFPTQFAGEGMPGCIVEALCAGTPILSSSFLQVKYILKDNYDSIIFDISHPENMIDILNDLSLDKNKLKQLSIGAKESAKKYIFSHNKETFFLTILGKK